MKKYKASIFQLENIDTELEMNEQGVKDFLKQTERDGVKWLIICDVKNNSICFRADKIVKMVFRVIEDEAVTSEG